MSTFNNPAADKLNLLRKSIGDFRIVCCGLSHEALVTDRISGLPVFYDVNGEKIFSTVGFCKRQDRGAFLQCAHSMAWYRLIDHLNELKATVHAGKLYLPVDEIQKIMLGIFELDHLRSDLEKSRAMSRFAQPGEITLPETDQKLSACLQEHAIHVRRLQKQRKMILQSIDAVIKSI
jgi:hypothetical protein